MTSTRRSRSPVQGYEVLYVPTVEETIELHDDLIRRSGGEPGILNRGILEAAVDRALHGPFPGPDSLEVRAAMLVRGIGHDHPFVDGNKRTGFAAAELMMRANGFPLMADSDAIVQLMLDVAQGKADVNAITVWLERAGRGPGEGLMTTGIPHRRVPRNGKAKVLPIPQEMWDAAFEESWLQHQEAYKRLAKL